MYDSENSYCNGDYYAGHWSDNICDKPLSGSTLEPELALSATEILDREGKNAIGLTIKYEGSPSGDYVLLDIYCDHGIDFWWDETYMVHTD